MKLSDLLFLLLAVALLILLNEFGYEQLLGRYAFIVFLVAYYAGKVITRWQQQKMQD